jgi:hypothetical protein
MWQWFSTALTWVVNLIFPFFEEAWTSRRVSRGVLLLLHILIVAAILVLLWYLDKHYFHIADHNVLIQVGLRPLRPFWLPILFLLIYTFCWLSWWLWKLFLPEAEVGAFPDIDRAWQIGCEVLAAAHISVRDLPLFLILGTPEDREQERSIFHGSQLIVNQSPDNPNDPVHVYATREGIFVTCAGASALGLYARSLVGEGPARSEQSVSLEEEEILATLNPRSSRRLDPQGAVEKMAAVLIQAEREGRPLTKAEKRELRCIYRQDNRQRSILKKPHLFDEQVARLEYLCRLIVRDRSPYCPINGILLMIPFAGLDSEEDASDTGMVCQRDLKTAIDTLRVHCPLIVLVCDLETAPGFTDFIQHFSQRDRLRRIGQRCHMVLEFPPSRQEDNGELPSARMARSLADWVCDSVVKTWVAEKFQLEKGNGALDSVVAVNSRLFLFFDELQQRNRRLGNILSSVVTTERDPERLLFGGCYLAGTGKENEQAFVRDVIRRLIESENCVYWTESARAEEASYYRWVVLGWTSLAVLVVLVAGLLAWLPWRAS